MLKIVNNVIQVRSGGRVERCHTIPHHGSYNNASHQWGVAILLWYLYPEQYAKLSIYALTHDVAESWVGDVPAPLRWALPDFGKKLQQVEDALLVSIGLPSSADLTREEAAVLKACDIIELLIWCYEQLDMGNTYARDCKEAIINHINKNGIDDTARGFITAYISKNYRTPLQQGVVAECLTTLN